MAVVAIHLSLAGVSRASADDSGFDRHPRRFSPKKKPAGVPADFVLTRAGFMHPACVITVRSDESVGRDGADLVVRGMDGSEHDRLPPCPYPRYRRDGQVVASAAEAGTPAQASTIAHQPHGVYDGWLASYSSYDSFDPGSSLSTEWYVPALPTNIKDQDIAFFNDICTSADSGDILQPVLDFSELGSRWAIESEHCCIAGNDSQSTAVGVSPGDLIRGTVVPSNCNSAGLCTTWTITTLDVTTGKSTVNNTSETAGKADLVDSAALESYGITACDMLPANGEITFFNNTLTSSSGAAQSLSYSLDTIKQRESGSTLPLDCGYAGSKSGNSFTLIWEKAHYAVGGADAGTSDAAATKQDAGGRDAGGVDGSLGSGGKSGSGGNAGTGGRSGSGGSSSTGGSLNAGGSPGTGGNPGSGGISSTGGGSGLGGTVSLGGSSGAGGRAGAGGSSGSGGSSSTGGSSSAGGSSGSGGTFSTGGSSGTGGTSVQGGSSGSGGTSTAGSGGQGGMRGGADAGAKPASASTSGCSCHVGGSRTASYGLSLSLLAALAATRILRRRKRHLC